MLINKIESDVQSPIMEYFKKNSIYAIKVIVANRNGCPDIIACINGRFIAFEVKRSEKEEPSELQKFNLRTINKNGGLAFVVSSLDDVKNILKGINEKRNHSKDN